MKTRLSQTITLLAVTIVIFSAIPLCLSEDFSVSYQLLDQPDGILSYELNVVAPESLLEHYEGKSHRLASTSDFSQFVTPYALQPIAENLWEIYKDHEDFVNAVLMIVHQIPYEGTAPPTYPVETIVANQGDCDLFSQIAASIMSAGGLDVVLLYYEDQSHMNVGVHLPEPPKEVRGSTFSITHNGVDYYIAECTGTEWENGWRVGECPEDLRQVTAQIIGLTESEQIAPGQVSASFFGQEPTRLYLQASPVFAIEKTSITIRGELNPNMSNQNITLYIKSNSEPLAILDTVSTGSDGTFQYIWEADGMGFCAIQASWPGDKANAGAISPTKNVVVIPLFLIAIFALALIAICIGAISVFIPKKNYAERPEPACPQPPDY